MKFTLLVILLLAVGLSVEASKKGAVRQRDQIEDSAAECARKVSCARSMCATPDNWTYRGCVGWCKNRDPQNRYGFCEPYLRD